MLGARDASFHFGASNLTDSPRELFTALRALLSGSRQERVTFLEEPGETVLEMRRLPGSLIHLKVYHGEDWGYADPDAGEPVFRHKVDLVMLTRTVLSQFTKHDPAEYIARWGHPYPAGAVTALTAQVRI